MARGAHLAAMREHGLTVEGRSAPTPLPQVNVTDDQRRIGAADIVLLAVKLWDTERRSSRSRPMVGPDTA